MKNFMSKKAFQFENNFKVEKKKYKKFDDMKIFQVSKLINKKI